MSLRPSEQVENRRSEFKVSVNAAEGRRRRVSGLARVRKESRDSALQKRRCAGVAAGSGAKAVPHPPALEKKLQMLPEMMQGLYSDDSSMQLEAIREFRKLLSIDKPPIQEVTNSGVVPSFVQLLSREDYPELQFEAAWALTNIVSGTSENTKVVIDQGAVPTFVKLLSSPSEDVREQAVWALGNVAGDSTMCRDMVLAHGALFPLLHLLSGQPRLSLLRNTTWALSNLCRGSPEPDFEHVKPALLVLQQLIHSKDELVLSDACWALSYLSDGKDDNARIQAVIETGACPRLVELLTYVYLFIFYFYFSLRNIKTKTDAQATKYRFSHPSSSVLVPSLRVVGNIVTGDDAQTQCIIDHQALPCLLNLLVTYQKKIVKKEACWTISNITAGNKEQIQAVINAKIIGPLVNLMQTAEFDVSKEAAWAIYNATDGGTHDQIKYLVSQGCIRAFCDLLSYSDARILMVCLEGLENILMVGEADQFSGACDFNRYAQMIDDAGGLDKIEDLQNHENNKVYEMAGNLLETYWLEEDDAMPSGGDAHQTNVHNGNQQVYVPPGGFKFG